MKYYKITRPYIGSYIQMADELLSALDAELNPGEEGNAITVSAIEMSEEEYKKLPEFTGW